MKLSKSKAKTNVHTFLQMAKMKFRPNQKALNKLKAPKTKSSKGSFLWGRSGIKSQEPQAQQQKQNKLQFIQKVSQQAFLIGNETQLDLIVIGNCQGISVTQCYWQFVPNHPIHKIAIDQKSKNNVNKESTMAIIGDMNIYIYKYDLKKMTQPFLIFTQNRTKQTKFLQFPSENNLAVFYKDSFEIIIIGDQKTRARYSNPYQVSANYEIFLVPPAFQQVMNAFFLQQNENSSTYALWCIQIYVGPTEVQVRNPQKIYDIQRSLARSLKIDNFSKEIFLMNLGFEILAVRSGYIIDSVNVNIQVPNTTLKFIPNDKLLLITQKKVQVYNFSIDKNSKPNRIVLKPKDSIKIELPQNCEYLATHQISNQNFAIFYQIIPQKNNRGDNEIIYWFTISQPIKLEDKVNSLFPIAEMDFIKKNQDILGQKCDMAFKMGLSIKQIFLQLWNRTSRASDEDYQLLLATKNYETIRHQVQRKLKKQSMTYREVIRIEQACYEMLKQMLFSTNCTQEILQNFIICHYFNRKLELYKDIVLNLRRNKQESDGKIMINIQDYKTYEQCDIKSFLLAHVADFCFEGKDTALTIRLAIRNFKFVFRVIYEELLEEIILTSKNQLLTILKAIPEFLPYTHTKLQDHDDPSLFDGVWPDITRQQWRQSLYVDNITTIDNRALVQKFSENIWFKRNWLYKHDLITKSKENILQIHANNNSDHIFYFFIAKMFETISDYNILREIVSFMQENYTKLPENLTGKIFLYDQLYRYLECRKMLPEKCRDFCSFLKLKDHDLFHHFFIGQRDRKGLILKQIKPIYENMGSNGEHIFNQSLLNYFSSELSEVSDLKYILNRINNEKKEFHQANEPMYEVLVQAMLMKLKVGSEYDVPIDEVLIYIESIPLTDKNNLMQHLVFIEEIKEQAAKFREMKLNMSLDEMIRSPQEVINKMVLYEMDENQIMRIQNWQDFIDTTYRCLATVQMRKEKLFQTEAHYLPFFVYLCKMLQNQDLIGFAAQLVQDPFLVQNFAVDIETVENIILYMYKWKFNEDSVYLNNQGYMEKIISLLPSDNSLRTFLEHQIQFATMLSCTQNRVQYPICEEQNQVPSISQLEEILRETPASHILQMDFQRLWEVMNKLQMLVYSGGEGSQGLMGDGNGLNPAKMITPYQIHEAVIMRLIELRKLKEVIPFIKEILNMEVSETRCNIVYPIIYIIQIADQMNSDSWAQMLRCACYFFFQPLKLLEIVEHLVENNLSNEERKNFLRQKAAQGKQNSHGYSTSNFLFSREVLSIINNAEINYDLMGNIELTNKRLQNTKEQFLVNKSYALILRMLCNDPYVLAKFFYIYRYQTNWRFMRSFMSYLINQEIFNNLNILEFGVRVFNCMLEAYANKVPIQTVISKYSDFSITQDMPIQQLPVFDQLSSKFQKSVQAFKKKKNITQRELQKKMAKSNPDDRLSDKEAYEKISEKGLEAVPSQYPYQQIDDDDKPDQGSFVKDTFRNRRKQKKTFDSQQQMKRMAMKKQNNLKMTTGALYDSYAGTGIVTRSLRLSQGFDQKYSKSAIKKNEMTASHQFEQTTNKNTQQIEEPIQFERQESDIIVDVQSPNGKLVIGKQFDAHPEAYPIQQQISEDLGSSQQRGMSNRIRHKVPQNLMTKSQQPQTIYKSFSPKLEFLNSHTEEVNKSQQIQIEQSDQLQVKKQDRTDRVDEGQMMHPPRMESAQFDSSPNLETMDTYVFVAEALYQDNKAYFQDQAHQQAQINLQSFRKYITQQNFQEQVMKILQFIYYHENARFRQVLSFFTKFLKEYPKSGINQKWIQIYSKGDNIHDKYNLDLPIRELFPMSGLFFDGRLPDDLFNNIKHQIISVLNEINVYKTVKVISLAFRNSKLEQQMIFCYLKDMIRKQITSENIPNDEKEMQMLNEKISVLVEKMKPDYLEKRIDEVFENTPVSEAKNKLIDIMVKSIGSRLPALKQKIENRTADLKG